MYQVSQQLLFLATLTSISSSSSIACTPSAYYSAIQSTLDDPLSLSASELDTILRDHIRGHTVIPYTSTNVDCWDALNILDADPSDADSVILIYKQTPDLIANGGLSTGWNREHVWPKSYGVDYSGPDTSDLHSLRAADWSVNSARNNRYYDDCTDVSVCTIPAHAEAASDTGKMALAGTTGIFMPPASVRGDLARSLFYMATRYDGSEANTQDLQLSNCPCDTTFKMGKLRTLLQWHSDDPPSAEEISRNSILCEDYQHNRNPFIDYPDLVPLVFLNDDDTSCPACPDSSPEDESADDSFFVESPLTLNRGAVALIGFNSDAPKSLQILSLSTLSNGANFYVTDNGYLGTSGFRTGEGTLKFTATSDIAPGTTLNWIDGDSSSSFGDWSEDGSFVLSASGDQLYMYTLSSDMSQNFVFALQYRAGTWDDEMVQGVDDSSTKGALPTTLTGNFAVALTHHDNKKWDGGGLTSGTKEDYLASICDSSEWSGDNGNAFTFASSADAYTVVPSPTPSPTSQPTVAPTTSPTSSPTTSPTTSPTSSPTSTPTLLTPQTEITTAANTTNATNATNATQVTDIEELVLSPANRLSINYYHAMVSLVATFIHTIFIFM